MTLGDLRTKLRARVLNASSANYYEDSDLLGMLEDASREIASAFRFPKKLIETVSSGSVSEFALPSGAVDIESVSFNGVGLARRAYSYVKLLQSLPAVAFPRGIYFDADRKPFGTLYLGPATAAGGTFQVKYIGSPYDAVVTASTEVWDGIYPGFHELVMLRGAVKAYEMTFELEDATYYIARYEKVLSEFAAFLGLPIPSTLGGQQGGQA